MWEFFVQNSGWLAFAIVLFALEVSVPIYYPKFRGFWGEFWTKQELKKYDIISQHNMDKYFALSKDDPTVYFHTPDKTLFVLINLKEKAPRPDLNNEKSYADYYKSFISDTDLIQYSSKIKDVFDSSVIYNDYENFINRTIHIILGKLK